MLCKYNYNITYKIPLIIITAFKNVFIIQAHEQLVCMHTHTHTLALLSGCIQSRGSPLEPNHSTLYTTTQLILYSLLLSFLHLKRLSLGLGIFLGQFETIVWPPRQVNGIICFTQVYRGTSLIIHKTNRFIHKQLVGCGTLCFRI